MTTPPPGSDPGDHSSPSEVDVPPAPLDPDPVRPVFQANAASGRLRTIGWDLDGVAYDFRAAVRQQYANELGVPVDQVPADDGRWEFYRCWGLDEAGYRALVRRGILDRVVFWQGQPVHGTREAMQALLDADWDIHIVTARASEGHGGGFDIPSLVRKATLDWLDDAGLPYTSLTFDHDKTSVRCRYFLEDNVANYDNLRMSGVEAVLLDQPWNAPALHPGPRWRVASPSTFAHAILHPTVPRPRQAGR